MNSRPTKQHLDAFVAHTMATLPDSFKLRKTILVTLVSLLPRSYEDRYRVIKSLEALRAHESTQLTFSLLQGDGQ